MENTYLIVGLGNPGVEYARTRHNVGFMAVEKLAEKRRMGCKLEERFQARTARADVEGKRLWVCLPETYMNASGTAVRAVIDYFNVPVNHLLVVVDDADLPLGQIRLRGEGSSGGHHGLESIEQYLGTRSYARLRIGIGREPNGIRQITGHVLGKFRPDEAKLLRAILERVVSQIECWLTAGLQKAMNQFNGAIEAPTAKES